MELTLSQVHGAHIADYVVIGVFLCICMGIGIYHGYRTKEQKTLESYFLGNRKLYMVPISLSIFVTFTSAISLIGLPTETYHYGIRGIYFGVPFLVSAVIANFTIVPLLYPLRLTSTYEYLELRFKSKGVRAMGTLIGMLNMVVYLSITLFAPAVALQTIAETPLWLSIVVIGVVGTIYTAIGGIKSVIWTDVFQFVMIVIGLVAIFVKGGLMLKGHSIIQIANVGKRLEFFNFDPDPRVRHSVWGLWFGLSFPNLSNWCSQPSLQRFSSVKSLHAAKMALLMVGPVAIIYCIILGFLGILLYSYYNVINCDPVRSGFLTSPNQLMPYFVLDIFRSHPGLSGIFISCLFSGSLSTFSSGINALAANTTEDIFGDWLKRSKKFSQILFAKVFVFFYGLLIIGLGYCVSFMSGNILQVAIAFLGACGGPSLGLFFLGGLVPRSNWIGAIAGSISGLVFNVWISIGSQLYGEKYLPLTGNPTSGCYTGNITFPENRTESYSYLNLTTLTATSLETTTIGESTLSGLLPVVVLCNFFSPPDFFLCALSFLDLVMPNPNPKTAYTSKGATEKNTQKETPDSTGGPTYDMRGIQPDYCIPKPAGAFMAGRYIAMLLCFRTDSDFFLYNISYTWYGFTGFLVTFMVGVLISCVTGWNHLDPVEARLVFPFCRKLRGVESQTSNEEVMEQTDLVKHETATTNPPGQHSLLHNENSF